MKSKKFLIPLFIISAFLLLAPSFVFASSCNCLIGTNPDKWFCVKNVTEDICKQANSTNTSWFQKYLTGIPSASLQSCIYFSGDDCTAAATVNAGVNVKTVETPFVPLEPKLQINIPTVQFTKATAEGGYATLPYLADYIAGVYKYAVGIVSIIAIIMIMIGGLRWMTAGGNASAISSAKETISGAVIGLILLFGSYTILYTVSPNLVSFGDLKIKLIQQQVLDITDNGEPCGGISSASSPKPITDSSYDTLFQKYGESTGVDWRVIKGVSFMESGLDKNDINKGSGAAGLMQLTGSLTGTNCPKNKAAALSDEACQKILDPDYNVSTGANYLKKAINTAKSYCPNADQQVLYTLAYMGYNSGTGSVGCATKKSCKVQKVADPIQTNGGCTLEEIKTGIITFWNEYSKVTGVDSGRGSRTFNFSVSVANQILSLTGGSAVAGGAGASAVSCPKNTAANTNGIKILAVGDSITAAGGSWAYKLKSAGYAVDVVAQSGQQTLWMWQQVSNQDFSGYTYVMVLGGINDIYSSGNGVQNAENNLTKIYQKAQTAGTKVVAITIPPSMGYSSWTTNIQTQTEWLNSWLKSQGDYQIDFYSLIADPTDVRQQAPTYSGPDHLHPNSAAHQLLANTITQNVLSK